MTSTSRIQQIALATKLRYSKKDIQFKVSSELSKKISEFKTIPALSNNTAISVDELEAALDAINVDLKDQKLAVKKRVILEQYKSLLMQTLLNHLKQLDKVSKTQKRKDDKKSAPFLSPRTSRLLKGGFIFIISTVGMIESSISVFLGCQLLMAGLIPTISAPLLLATSLFFTVVSCILFIAFEVWMLQNLFGLSILSPEKEVLLRHKQQIDIANQLNERLTNVALARELSAAEYLKFKNLTYKINTEIEAKEPQYPEYKESLAKKIARWFLTLTGALLTGFGSYFGAYSLLAAFAAPLLATPVGWAISGILVLSALVFYFSMEGDGLIHLFNSTAKAYNKVRDGLSSFINKRRGYELDHSLLYRSKNDPTVLNKSTKKSQTIEALNLEGYQPEKPARYKDFFTKANPKINLSRRASEPLAVMGPSKK